MRNNFLDILNSFKGYTINKHTIRDMTQYRIQVWITALNNESLTNCLSTDYRSTLEEAYSDIIKEISKYKESKNEKEERFCFQ